MKKDKDNDFKVRIAYNKGEDEYDLMLSIDGGETWGFSRGTKCMHYQGQDPEEEPMHISCTIIEELKKSILLGYEFVY